MSMLANELLEKTDLIVDRWYRRWREGLSPRGDITEVARKDSLPLQLRIIGEQLLALEQAEDPEGMWRISERLDPEARIAQDVSIEQLVQEYRFAVEAVREWLDENEIKVPFEEYSYFYAAMFELTAESVRRYAKRQAEETREVRGHYLAGVMHQLRTPLTSLSMQIEVLDRTGRPLGSNDLALLRRSVRRTRLLVDSILRLERFRPSEVPIHAEQLFPARLIADIVADYKFDAEAKGLKLEVHVDPLLQMSVDPNLFIDALGNLIQNAIRYTPEGYVLIEACSDDGAVMFRVKDSGPGVPAERWDRLFEESLPSNGGGAGIGLQIAQHAARAMGGSIELESASAHGSVFALRLPVSVESRESRGRESRPAG